VLKVHVVREGGHGYYVDDLVPGRAEGTLVAGEARGAWSGNGAASLGLRGPVEAEAFAELLGGCDPASATVLRSRRGDRSVAGYDLTFCAAKTAEDTTLAHMAIAADSKPFVIYARLSQANEDRETPSIDRQIDICSSYLDSHELPYVSESIVRETASASKANVERKKFKDMLGRLEAGEFSGLIVWKLDRLTRQPRELPTILDALDKNDTQFISVTDNVDTSTFLGKSIVNFMISQAAQESLNTSIRVSAAELEAAEAGEMKAGGRRCYGYSGIGKGEGKGEIFPKEAHYLRLAAQDIVIAKVSLREATRRINLRGSRTTMKNEWSPRSLVKCLKSPRLRAKRIYQPDKNVPALYFDGNWEPIFTEQDHLVLIDRINRAGKTYREHPRRVGNHHLLTGLAICGICGHKMAYNRSRSKTGDVVRPRYQCKRAPGSTGCGKVSVDEASLDRYVIGCVREFGGYFVMQAEERRRELVDQISADQAELEDIQRRYDQLQHDYYFDSKRPMSEKVYSALTSKMLARMDELKEALSRPQAELDRLPQSKPSWIRGSQSKMPEGIEGREYLRRFLKAVEVLPARKRGVRFEGGRVKLHWIGGQVTTDADLGIVEYAADLGIL